MPMQIEHLGQKNRVFCNFIQFHCEFTAAITLVSRPDFGTCEKQVPSRDLLKDEEYDQPRYLTGGRWKNQHRRHWALHCMAAPQNTSLCADGNIHRWRQLDWCLCPLGRSSDRL